MHKTRWRSVSGTVYNSFNDILVLTSTSLPRHLTIKREPWDLHELVPYKDDYLSSYRTAF